MSQPVGLLDKATSKLPAYLPRFERARPVVAVVAENTFTELTDFVIPYGVLRESGVAQVLAIATKPDPIKMLPNAFQIVPQETVETFDSRFPEGADYVVVPAVARNRDPSLLAWIRTQAQKGAVIVGICDGVWVLANADLLKGRKSVGHWFSFKRLAKKNPDAQWLRNTRYVADGNVMTTTGITASIPASVAIVEAIAGTETASILAKKLGIESWGTEHPSEQFKLGAKPIATAIINGLSFWAHEKIGVRINDGVDEMALALVTDTYSRTFRSKVILLSQTTSSITTRRGLEIIPATNHSLETSVSHTIDLRFDSTTNSIAYPAPVSWLEKMLQEITQRYGSNTADFVALQLEYPRSGT
ncbi:MAG: DJ-1/PfpI family protein [Cyanobacteria bacterium J06631_12]